MGSIMVIIAILLLTGFFTLFYRGRLLFLYIAAYISGILKFLEQIFPSYRFRCRIISTFLLLLITRLRLRGLFRFRCHWFFSWLFYLLSVTLQVILLILIQFFIIVYWFLKQLIFIYIHLIIRFLHKIIHLLLLLCSLVHRIFTPNTRFKFLSCFFLFSLWRHHKGISVQLNFLLVLFFLF